MVVNDHIVPAPSVRQPGMEKGRAFKRVFAQDARTANKKVSQEIR
jgi:hypothetical protein